MRFSVDVICPTCGGNGKAPIELHAEDILLVVLHNSARDGTVNKLQAIKQVRSEYRDIGLKLAKELVEGAMEYFEVIQNLASDIPYAENHEADGRSDK